MNLEYCTLGIHSKVLLTTTLKVIGAFGGTPDIATKKTCGSFRDYLTVLSVLINNQSRGEAGTSGMSSSEIPKSLSMGMDALAKSWYSMMQDGV